MFNFFKKPIKGLIGYYKLSDWWTSEFSKEERIYMVEKYSPFGLSNKNPLISGDIQNNTMPIVHFLYSLSEWFFSKEGMDISEKILKKAELFIDEKTDIIDLHFFIDTKIKFYQYKKDFVNMQKECENQIKIADKVAKKFQEQYNENIPSHNGYDFLINFLEEKGKNKEAIFLATQAKKEGWTNSEYWDREIKRLSKKITDN